MSKISLSKNASRIVQSEIRIMSVECEKVRGVNLAQGICDTEIPLPVRRAAHAAIDGGMNSYTRLIGLDDLRRAISRKLREYNRITADPETEIIVTVGSTGAFYSACMALLDPGDEVIVFEPFYSYHVNTLSAMNARAVYVTLKPPDWSFTRDALQRAVTSATKAIVLNTPANPSGKVFSRHEIEVIADFAIQHDLFVFTDEIYEYFLYDGAEHVSPASLPGMRERTITISGFSKTFSVTGWRVGYLACSARWAPSIGYFHDLAYVCAPSPLQRGVAAGLDELTADFYSNLALEYLSKRDLLCSTLQQVGLHPWVPQGSYYVLADASALPGRTSKEKAMWLLKNTGVAAVPGDSFFHDDSGRNLLRFCFAKTDVELAEACRRLEKLKAAVAVG
jgi:aminotransferase